MEYGRVPGLLLNNVDARKSARCRNISHNVRRHCYQWRTCTDLSLTAYSSAVSADLVCGILCPSMWCSFTRILTDWQIQRSANVSAPNYWNIVLKYINFKINTISKIAKTQVYNVLLPGCYKCSEILQKLFSSSKKSGKLRMQTFWVLLDKYCARK